MVSETHLTPDFLTECEQTGDCPCKHCWRERNPDKRIAAVADLAQPILGPWRNQTWQARRSCRHLPVSHRNAYRLKAEQADRLADIRDEYCEPCPVRKECYQFVQRLIGTSFPVVDLLMAGRTTNHKGESEDERRSVGRRSGTSVKFVGLPVPD